MAKRLLTHDDITNTCELAELTPYPVVAASADGTTIVTATVGPTGLTTYTVAAAISDDCCIDTFTFNPTSGVLTITTMDGTAFPVTLSLCAMLAGIPNTATKIGG